MKPSLALALAFLVAAPALAQQPPARSPSEDDSPAGASRPRLNDDASITAQVEHALRKLPDFDARDIRVNSYAGTVQLMGWVDNAEQRLQAAQAAISVPGVQQVDNSLEVK